jgi:hypothetical protein
MVEGMGTVAHRRLVGISAWVLVASVGAAQVPGTTPPLAAPQAPPAPVASTQPGAWWARLGPASGNDAVKSLRFRPPALRATMLADALAASEVRADPALRERVLRVVAAFPEQASALVAEFLAAEPPANERDRTPVRASKGALAFVGAVAERATVAEAARLAAWLEGHLRHVRWSDPADRPALQLWAQLTIAAVVGDPTSTPHARRRQLGLAVDATETGWALAEALLRHPIGGEVAGWLADTLRREEPRVPFWVEVARHLSALRSGPGLASSHAARANLIARLLPEDPLAPYGIVLQLVDTDPAIRERAQQVLWREPPTGNEFAGLVVQAAGLAGVDLQHAVLAWLARGTADPGLGCAWQWTPATWDAFVQQVGARKTIREHLLAGPPEGTLLALGVDLGIERLLDELARVDAWRRDLLADPTLVASFPSIARDARSLQEALWGDRAWFDDKGALVFDLHDEAAVDRALRELPAVPAGSVLRLVRIAIDQRLGDRTLARACLRHVLSAVWDEVPSSRWSGPPTSQPAALRMPRVVVGSPQVWQQLAAVAASVPHLAVGGGAVGFEANTALAANFVLASQQVGQLKWPEPPARSQDAPPGPGGVEMRDPLLEFWGRRSRYTEGVPKVPPRWFAGVELHRRDIDGLPAIEYTLRPAEPAPR